MWHLFTSKLYQNREINFHLISLEIPALEEDSWWATYQPIVSIISQPCEEAILDVQPRDWHDQTHLIAKYSCNEDSNGSIELS